VNDRPSGRCSIVIVARDHAPSRADDEIDEIVGSLAVARVPVAAAAEGMVLTL
jgi:hypothetical protein